MLAAGRPAPSAKTRVVGRKVVEAQVVDLDEAELLEVRVRVAPAAALVEPDPVREDLRASVLSASWRLKPLKRRLEQPLRADLGAGPVEAERLLLRVARARRCAGPFVAGRLEGAEEAGADQADEEEVVEVAGLQGGVLRLSVKPRSLRVYGSSPESPPCIQRSALADQHRRGRASAFGRERGQAVAVPGRAALRARRSAGRSGTCRAGTRPCVPEPTLPVGSTRSPTARARFAVVRLEPRVAGGVELEPGLRVVLVAVGEGEVRRPRRGA